MRAKRCPLHHAEAFYFHQLAQLQGIEEDHIECDRQKVYAATLEVLYNYASLHPRWTREINRAGELSNALIARQI